MYHVVATVKEHGVGTVSRVRSFESCRLVSLFLLIMMMTILMMLRMTITMMTTMESSTKKRAPAVLFMVIAMEDTALCKT